MSYSQNPIHFNDSASVPLYCGDGITAIAIGAPIIQRAGAILPSGMDTGVISIWSYGAGGIGGGSIWHLEIVGNAQNATGPYAPRLTFQAEGSAITFSPVSSANAGMFTAHLSSSGDTDSCTVHILLSFRLSTSTVQVAINDVMQSVSISAGSAGTFGATPASTVTAQYVPGTGGAPTGGAYYSDAWFGTTASFVDLTVISNRRKFINADLTPVDLGANGQNPFGTSPQLFCNVLTGGVASDWLTNRGIFGGTFSAVTGTLSVDGNPCGSITPPPTSLAMDNLVCMGTAPAPPGGNQVFLEWSDNRGRSYGSPVGQEFGPRGFYRRSLLWQRLGMGRDRVFRVSWSVPEATALQGAFIEADSSAKS